MNFAKTSLVELKEKIVGSKQKVEQFMSDLAKNLAKDYKPPYTTLKINLTPKALGNIDVVIRGTKTRASIFFQSNQIQTHELLTSNQNELKTALLKHFGNDSMFNLNFANNPENQQQVTAQYNRENNKQNSKNNGREKKDEDEEKKDEELNEIKNINSNEVYI